MKIFIWFMCILVVSAARGAIKMSGVILGGIPTFIMYALAIVIAKLLCDKWAKRNGNQVEFEFDENDNLVRKDNKDKE